MLPTKKLRGVEWGQVRGVCQWTVHVDEGLLKVHYPYKTKAPDTQVKFVRLTKW